MKPGKKVWVVRVRRTGSVEVFIGKQKPFQDKEWKTWNQPGRKHDTWSSYNADLEMCYRWFKACTGLTLEFDVPVQVQFSAKVVK